MTLDDIKTALLTVGVPVSHYAAFEQSDNYVWAEDNQADSYGLMERCNNRLFRARLITSQRWKTTRM